MPFQQVGVRIPNLGMRRKKSSIGLPQSESDENIR